VDREFEFTDSDMTEVRRLIKDQAGISIAPTKRELIYTRLRKRLRAIGLTSCAEYLEFLATHPDETQAFVNSLTTNLTSFFRESAHFDTLKEFIHAHSVHRPLRIWCAAASTGEEPYTLAMTVVEATKTWTPNATITATDIDTDVLAKARRGTYPLKAIEGIEREVVNKFFLRGTGANAGQCRVRPELQSLIKFQQLNLLDPHWDVAHDYDVIFCRNVFFYFDKPTQLRILERLHERLNADGLLFTGHSENFFREQSLFRAIGHSVYQSATKKDPSAA
jgi:chemotaxis protein methyltransferase CheR